MKNKTKHDLWLYFFPMLTLILLFVSIKISFIQKLLILAGAIWLSKEIMDKAFPVWRNSK